MTPELKRPAGRLRESIHYADIMSGRQPDPDVAERAVRALLTSG